MISCCIAVSAAVTASASLCQVESPSPKGDASLHGLNLDWKRFVTDQTADFVKWEISALRDAACSMPGFFSLLTGCQFVADGQLSIR